MTPTTSWLRYAVLGLGCASLVGCGDDGASSGDAGVGGDGDVPLVRTQCPGDPACPDEGDDTFHAAAAIADLTPPDLLEGPSWVDTNQSGAYERTQDDWVDTNGSGRMEAVWIAGFGQGRPALGVHDPIEARIVVMRHNATTVALVSADLIGFFYHHLQGVYDRLAPAVAGEVDLILWTSAHNHEGPDTMGQWGPSVALSGIDPAYLELVQTTVAARIGEAVAALEPARVFHGSIAVEDEGGSMMNLFEDSRDPVVINNLMNVMRFARQDGSTIATVVNLGTHPEVLWSDNQQLTADFVYYLRKGVEEGVPGHFEGLGGTTLYVQSTCGGLITPGHVAPYTLDGTLLTETNTFAAAEVFGQRYADFAVRALDPMNGAVEDTQPFLRFRTREVFLTVENFLFQAASLLGILKRPLYHYDPDAALDPENTPDILSQVVYLQVGLASMATVPGELAPEVFLGGYDGSFAGGYPLVRPDNPNPPDLDAAPGPPYLRDVLAADGSQFQWLIGLGQDEVGYLVPNYDYQLDAENPYLSEPPGDHYCETNSLGPSAHDQILLPLTDLIMNGN